MASVTEERARAATPEVDPALLRSLEWRLIGPFRGGRVVAVAGDPVHEQVFYFGSTGGGVWKTTDGGVYWRNVSDGYFERASVGAIAVAESDPNVIYVGMGETTIRGNVSHGDGVYKSTDAGKTWQHCGLAATRNIAKVRVHPRNPDLVYVAALGHVHGPNPERGVYRSRDGGKTWELVLFRSDKAGASDLALDPNNPRVLYAAFWEAYRGPHEMISGGEGSGLFRSTDGGDTWVEISRHKGLPKGVLGKIGVVASPARAGRVWAIVEAEDGAVFRSDDGGDTWQRLCEERALRGRAWYYHHIYADPQDPETLWVLNVPCMKSIDGGKTFFQVAVPHGDNHDLWIDPQNPRRIINGNDGGACVSFNGGETWSTLYNQPTAEFYHVTTDTRTPYWVYGAQQDNTTISLPSRSPLAAIGRAENVEVGGGESGYIAVKPDDPNIIFAGSYQGMLTRYDHRTGQRRNITVWPEGTMGHAAKDVKYRFQWTSPTILSPHDPNILYTGGNHVFRSTDEGASWAPIGPDLTRHDEAKLGPSGGPITRDNVGTEYYATVFALAESPAQAGVLWAGSDDGLIHVTRDNGQSWQNVTPPADLLPEWALISIIEASPHDPAAAYVAANRYKHDDFRPYVLKTADYGATWTAINTSVPADDFARAIREDPARRGLLYAGTETGVYVSFDDGAHWQSLRLDLPVVPIHDLVVKEGDL
ncbi:MAG TPA: glycosyl hydrolase, partial [Thermomicrobiales bacterium]|nr:glycosyl hydrolase [Thermomicrobiales bacterium]